MNYPGNDIKPIIEEITHLNRTKVLSKTKEKKQKYATPWCKMKNDTICYQLLNGVQ